MTKLHLFLPALILFALSGCAGVETRSDISTDTPDAQLSELFARYKAGFATGSVCHDDTTGWRSSAACESLRREARQLYVRYPRNERVILFAAVLAQQVGQRGQAGHLLDQLLASRQAHPEAAILRSRIAMEEGNLNLARRLLQQQIHLNPQDAMLHETLAAVHYLEQRDTAAYNELALAEQLGAPAWRINYHRGLLSERRHNSADACDHYRLSIQANPQFTPARQRARGLKAAPACHALQLTAGGATHVGTSH